MSKSKIIKQFTEEKGFTVEVFVPYRVKDFCVNCGEYGKNCKCVPTGFWDEKGGPLDPDTLSGKFKMLGNIIGELVDEKNRAYGNSFKEAGIVLRALYPEGISPEQYEDMMAIVRIIDKLFRIASSKNALGESPYKDIAGYGLLGWLFCGDGQSQIDENQAAKLFGKMEINRGLPKINKEEQND